MHYQLLSCLLLIMLRKAAVVGLDVPALADLPAEVLAAVVVDLVVAVIKYKFSNK